MKRFLKHNVNKIVILIIVFNLFVYTLLSTVVYADDFVDKPVVTKPSTDLSTFVGPQQITSELVQELVSWESGKLNDILDEQIGADDVLKDYYEVYYDLLVNDYQSILEKYCYGDSPFNSDGSFLEEYTSAYYRHYFKALYQFSEPFDWDIFIDYANERHKSELSGGSTDTVSYIKKRGSQPRFSSQSFKQCLDSTESVYYLKNTDQNIISFRNNVRDIGFIDCFGTYENRYFRLAFLDDGALKEYSFYITPFCDIDGKRYTSENTFRFFNKNEVDEEGFSFQNLYVEMYIFDNGEFVLSEEPQVIASEYGVVRYVELLFGFTSTAELHFHSYNYKLYKDFMSSTARTDSTLNPDQMVVSFDPAYSSLLLYNSYPDDYVNIFDYVYHYNAANCVLSSHNCSYEYCDLGFVRTENLPSFSYSIDTTKIPDNYYITVSGDTIYDYSITNPETGQSSTINEYITNNYTYITNNNTGGDGSGNTGTVGGDVNVGGNVGVNGNVNVGGEVKFGGEVSVGVDVSPIDVNVNVSGAGESGGEPPELNGIDDYVDYLPEKSPVISEYLKIFFDTLPPELLHLILAGVATAIIILIFRR